MNEDAQEMVSYMIKKPREKYSVKKDIFSFMYSKESKEE